MPLNKTMILIGAILLITGCGRNPFDSNGGGGSQKGYGLTELSGGTNAGITPGGSQDIGYVREIIAAGMVPDPAAITYEGLFSEHDFDLDTRDCDQHVCVDYSLARYATPQNDEYQYLAQLLLTSSIDLETFVHQPTDFIVVFDRSGSMTGEKFAETCNTLEQLVNFLNDDDGLGLISFNSEYSEDWELSFLEGNRAAIIDTINSLDAGGSTDIESALEAGYVRLAESDMGSNRQRRVLLFTDALPNTGNTDESDFLILSENYARQDIGLTAFGVGLDFGFELATAISELRGGNYVFLRDADAIGSLVNEQFEFLITPVAYDFELSVLPDDNVQLENIYGLPGSPAGEFSFQAATLFLSSNKGSIGLAFTAGQTTTARLSHLSLSYEAADGSGQYMENLEIATDELISGENSIDYDQPGVQKLVFLVEMVTGMKTAIALYQDGNAPAAVDALADLDDYLTGINADLNDATLAIECELVRKLAENMQ